MTVIVRDSYIIAEIDGILVKFGGKRTVTGFEAYSAAAVNVSSPDGNFSDEQLHDIIRAVKAHCEKSYIEITFE